MRIKPLLQSTLRSSNLISGVQGGGDIPFIVLDAASLFWFPSHSQQSVESCANNRNVGAGLISNGFYAATKRKEQSNSDAYEPTLTATTKNLGEKVEIRIRDNGLGIPPEVREKMFNPFFTTKPAGEGTGLGLSITHDIIVKQHSGAIEVDTQPGEYTEIKVILPRTATFIAESRGGA